VVRHAYANVPFYRQQLDTAGVSPHDIRGVQDIEALPLTSKSDLRRAPLESRIAGNVTQSRLIRRKTSGSTGEPFTIFRTILEDRLLHLFRIRALRQIGVRARDRVVSVAASRLTEKPRTAVGRLTEALNFYQQRLVDCERPDEAVLQDLVSSPFDILSGYPGALAHIAPMIVERFPEAARPRLVCTGGEPLTLMTRRRLAEVFGAPVFDFYGAHEFNLLAWQCPLHDHLHVCDDNVILEIVRDGQPVEVGERGEVVATGLFSLAMPFVRYRMGDLATRGADRCPCGQPFSTIDSIDGRSVDYFRLPDGRLIHPYVVTTPLIGREEEWIHQYQLLQTSVDRVVLRIVPLRPPGVTELDRMRQAGREALGPTVRFEVELTNEIPPDRGGKFRSYRSLLNDDETSE
jgi:phenylacetate-CoA ligase